MREPGLYEAGTHGPEELKPSFPNLPSPSLYSLLRATVKYKTNNVTTSTHLRYEILLKSI